MSLFDAFVGGAADQATGILDRQMKEEADLERQKQLTQFQADLAGPRCAPRRRFNVSWRSKTRT